MFFIEDIFSNKYWIFINYYIGHFINYYFLLDLNQKVNS